MTHALYSKSYETMQYICLRNRPKSKLSKMFLFTLALIDVFIREVEMSDLWTNHSFE